MTGLTSGLFIASIAAVVILAAILLRLGPGRPPVRRPVVAPRDPTLPPSPMRPAWLLSKVELEAYRALLPAVPLDCLLLAKVRVADLVWVADTGVKDESFWKRYNRVAQASVLFVVFHPGTGKVLRCLELPTPTTRHTDREQAVREALVEAGIPLFTLPQQGPYETEVLERCFG